MGKAQLFVKFSNKQFIFPGSHDKITEDIGYNYIATGHWEIAIFLLSFKSNMTEIAFQAHKIFVSDYEIRSLDLLSD